MSAFFKMFYGIAVLALIVPISAHAADPAAKCEAGKLKAAGKYAACRLGVDSKAVAKGAATDFTKCATKFSGAWTKLETKAGTGVCPSEGDESQIDDRITQNASDIAALLSGGTPSTCSGQLPGTGETADFGAGSAGVLQTGGGLYYSDNGDGTITDNNTCLTWEKKDDSGGIHDMDNAYTWSTGTNNLDGTVQTVFLDTLNDVAGGGANCFAGHCDWRLPNLKELATLVDYSVNQPAVAPVFRTAGCTGCTDVTLPTCSCTNWTASSTLSSSTVSTGDNIAWTVVFGGGGLSNVLKTNAYPARAVRGGS